MGRGGSSVDEASEWPAHLLGALLTPLVLARQSRVAKAPASVLALLAPGLDPVEAQLRIRPPVVDGQQHVEDDAVECGQSARDAVAGPTVASGCGSPVSAASAAAISGRLARK
jgi:hypothetical protein